MDTTQGHPLKASVWDDPVYHVHAWEHGVSACNPVQAILVDVHVYLVVFEVFPKCAYKCIIDLFPFQLDVLV